MDGLKQILHIDMDAFYATIEQRDNPSLRGMPVCVGGNPKIGRGVVMACSYEARKYGIHSAMPVKKAFRLCPQAIFVKPRFDVYFTESKKIKKIFYEFTDRVQPLSLDEAYLDISEISNDFQTSEQIAKKILNKIYKTTGLTASAGVSFNKFLAKIGSDFNKPNGITVITIDNADEFIDNLPIDKFYGVGKVTEKKMLGLGLKTGADLKVFGLENLKKHFGKAGEYFFNCAVGVDDREVHTNWQRKSLGKQRTLPTDIDDIEEMVQILQQIVEKISNSLIEKKLKGQTVTLIIRYNDFQRITRSITLCQPVNDLNEIMENINKLLYRTEVELKKVRLLGISISNFVNDDELVKQTTLEI
jgi:DNA polymerase-4